MYAIFLGKAVQTVNPPAGSVGLSQLSATGTKDSTTFLRGDNTFGVPPLGGITEADQWRLTTHFTGDANPIASNLERVDSDGFSLLGTGMTQSSGIFSFPSTGYWFIRFTANYYGNGNTGSYMETTIMTTTDNSTYGNASLSYQTMPTSTADVSASAEFLFDVTNTSTHKVRFKTTSNITNLRTYGNTDLNMTYMTFIKLGDT
jgi:hypothetical protein